MSFSHSSTTTEAACFFSSNDYPMPEWYFNSYRAIETIDIALILLLIVFHSWRLIRVWRILRHWNFLVSFHALSLTGFLCVLPSQIMDLSCFSNRFQWPLCNSWDSTSTHYVGVLVSQIVLMGFYNLGGFSGNFMLALLGFYTRKEIVIARNGYARWKAGHRPMTAFTCLLAALGSLFFFSYAPWPTVGILDWQSNAETVIIWIGIFVRILTVAAATLQVGILAFTLHYSQRVLPFMNTRLLLLAMCLATLGKLHQALYNLPELLDCPQAQVGLEWAELVLVHASNFLLAFLFRRNPRRKPTEGSLLLINKE